MTMRAPSTMATQRQLRSERGRTVGAVRSVRAIWPVGSTWAQVSRLAAHRPIVGGDCVVAGFIPLAVPDRRRHPRRPA